MTSGFASGYKMESGEARALRSINTESYDYRDQGKLLTKLTSDVTYMAQYMRQMQKGIDDANANFIEQIGDFVNEIIVVLGGNGNTSFDFGDLKYVLQAIGALFGFDEQTGIASVFPINLFNAAWHFFSTYILPLNNFGDAVDNFIDSSLATILDVLGEIPVVGQAAQILATWISDLRDGVTNVGESLNNTIDDLTQLITDLWNNPAATIQAIGQDMVTGLQGALSNLNNFIQNVVDNIISALSGIPIIGGAIAAISTNIKALFQNLFRQDTPKNTVDAAAVPALDGAKIQSGSVAAARIASLDAGKITTGTFGATRITDGAISNIKLGTDISGDKIVAGTVVAGRIGDLDGSKITTGTIGTAIVPNLDAGKITTGAFVDSRIPALDAGKITTGSFLDARIPGLDGSKITGGTVAEARVQNLTTAKNNASTALTNAGVARSIAASSIQSGANLVANPGFENTNFLTSNLYSTEQKRSGTRSLKLNGTGSTLVDAFVTIDNTAIQFMPCSENDVYYMEFWIRGHTDNVGGGNIQMFMSVYDTANVALAYPSLTITNVSTAYKNVWTKVSGYTTALPANSASMHVRIRLQAGVPSTDSYYFDDVAVYRVTETATTNQALYSSNVPAQTINTASVPSIDGSKINTGTLAEDRIASLSAGKITSGSFGNNRISDNAISESKIQNAAVTGIKTAGLDGSKITSGEIAEGLVQNLTTTKNTANTAKSLANSAIQAGPNLATNPGFENTSLPIVGSGFSDTTVFRTGSRSLGITGNGNYNTVWLTADGTSNFAIPVSPGDSYYAEFWVYGSSSSTTGTVVAAAEVKNANGTIIGYPLIGKDVDSSLNNNWTKVSGIIKMPENASTAGFFLQVNYLVTSGTFWFDDVSVFRVTESINTNQALYSSNVPALTINTASVPSIDGSKINTGTLAEDRIASLSQSKITGLPGTLSGIEGKADAVTQAFTEALKGSVNLCPNPGFEDTAAVLGWQTSQLSLNTNIKRTDSRSLRVQSASPNDVYFYLGSTRFGETYYKSGPNLKYYFEAWVYADTGNISSPNGPGQVDVLFGIWFYGADSSYKFAATVPFLDGSPKGQWVKVSGTLVAPNDSTITYARPLGLVVGSGGLGTNNFYYIDDVVLKEITEAYDANQRAIATNQALYSSNTPNLTINSGVLPQIDGAKIITGTVAEDRIAALSAGKITSGSFGNNRISNDAITTDKIANNAVTGAKQGFLDATKIVSGQIQADLIGQLSQGKVTGLPVDVEVLSALLAYGQKIAQLESVIDTASNQGKAIAVNFASFNDGNLPSSFTISYDPASGPTSTIQVVGGQAKWVNGNNSDRKAKIIYTGSDGKTLTNFQSIKGTLGSIPSLISSGPKFTAIGRVSDDGNSFVWARAGWTSSGMRGEMGCTINNVETVWLTNIPLTFNLSMTFALGANQNVRAYQVYSGDKLVATYEEGFASLAQFPTTGVTGRLYVDNANGNRYTWNGSAYVSSSSSASLLGTDAADSNYRRWGAIAEIKFMGGQLVNSGAVASVSVSDNNIPQYKGNVAKFKRKVSAPPSHTVSIGTSGLVGNFFDIDYETLDIDADPTAGSFTVTKEKMYAISARVRLNGSSPSEFSLDLQKWNGSSWGTIQKGDTIYPSDIVGDPANFDSHGMTGNWLEYLKPSDKIRLATWREGGTESVTAVGSGAEVYFTIAGMG